jgi:hypothetical protein
MSDAQKKIAATIEATLLRHWTILCEAGPVDDTDTLGDAVTRMLRSCANNLAMILPELIASTDRTVHALPSAIERWTEEHGKETDGSDLVRYVAERAYAEGAKGERLTLSREWELDRVADDVREACAVLCEDVGRAVAMRLTPEGQAVLDGTDRCAAKIRETTIAP